MTITRNLVAEDARRRRPAVAIDERIGSGDSLEREVSARSDLATVRRAIGALPEDTRMALLLRSEGRLSYDEISAVLGTSAAAARVKVHRARLALARSIELPGLEKPQ